MTRGSALRLAVGPFVLAAILWWTDVSRVAAYWAAFDPLWLAPMVGVSGIQYLVSAWRWRFTARQLGLAITRRRALGDYYLAVFLNQCLPAGVLGDITRAWRHARATQRRWPAAQAVLLERISGQVAFALVAVVSLPLAPGIVTTLGGYPAAFGVAAVAAVLAAGLIRWHVRRHPGGGLSRGLLARRVWPRQLTGSLIVVGSYVTIYILAARAIGVTRPVMELLPLVPPVLLAMAVPLSVAGWGVREGAAALVWLAAGLPASEGVAIAVAYGAANLAMALPGLAVLLWSRPPGQAEERAGDDDQPFKSRSKRTSEPS